MKTKNFYYSEECKKWVIDNNGNYRTLKEMYSDYIKQFPFIKYTTFRSLRSRLVDLESKTYTEEEKNFIVEMVVDNELGYTQIAKLFNEKFNKNKTGRALAEIGRKWGLKCIHFNHKWKDDYSPNVPIDYHYNNQHPIGTIKKVKRGKRYKLIIKIKMIPKEIICSKKHFIDDNEYWYPYARYVYEQHYNVKLKDNEYVYHLDGDMYNNNIDNLICGTYGTLGYAVAKGYLDSEPEIRSLGLKLGKLNSILKSEGSNNGN